MARIKVIKNWIQGGDRRFFRRSVMSVRSGTSWRSRIFRKSL